MKKQNFTILLLDPDPSMSSVLSEYLSGKGFGVRASLSATDIRSVLAAGPADLIVYDVAQPNRNGFALLHTIREATLVPIFVLSARSDRQDILRAYELGADDYMLKPFSMEILAAKLKAWEHRLARMENTDTVFDLNGTRFDSAKQMLGDQRLTGRESDFLLLLCRSMGNVVDKHLVLRTIWGRDDEFAGRSLSVFASRLRAILAPFGMSVVSVHGRGYKLVKKGDE